MLGKHHEHKRDGAPRIPTKGDAALPSDAADDHTVNVIVSSLVRELHPARIYLFGSRARGDAHADSDYDILVLVRERTGVGRELERQANAALAGLTVPIDVVILTAEYYSWMLDAAASLPATVEREGRLVYAA